MPHSMTWSILSGHCQTILLYHHIRKGATTDQTRCHKHQTR